MNEENNTKQHSSTCLGTVVTNIDPLKQGRLLVKVPNVLGDDPCIWAISASPIAGIYAIPAIGDGVWILFQDGDPNYAVWTGSWRGSSADIPASALLDSPATPPIVLQSLAQNKVIVSSTPGQGILLETSLGKSGPSIEVTTTGITISAGPGQACITLKGTVVDINNNALKII
jgi:Type VI secretion system/phage-baseplate injector OB domain